MNFYLINCKNDSKKLLNKDIISSKNINNINNIINNNLINVSQQNSGNISKTNNQIKILKAYSTVGTLDSISPEVFGKERYRVEIDWRSIAVMFFEMVVGTPLFF